VEAIGRSLGYPVRWVWIGALALLVGLAAAAPIRGVSSAPFVHALPQATGVTIAPNAMTPSWTDRIRTHVDRFGQALNAQVDARVRSITRMMPRRTPILFAALSAIASFTLFAIFGVVHLRFRRARQRWPLADMHGVRVRVAPSVGPVVIGVLRPEIVVPHWLLGRSPEEQRLVVAHEAEHVRARDTLLLGAACVVVAIMPWNPVVWYMLSRLRLAVELDCDARVLRAGAVPFSYGSLLIDMAENTAVHGLSAPALADDSSHLHQRIRAMNATRSNFVLVRGGALGAL
jgi:beta-lactamase regulating signal transducer with metallopeptidase domain